MCQARDERTICVLLSTQAIVSFCSVPRILGLFSCEAIAGPGWVPHSTFVINGTLRLGLGLLQQIVPIETPWLAIIDHSIDIGTNKALVVLRVPLTALATRGSAICLEDGECVGLKISHQIKGETVAADLKTIFTQAGLSAAIIKDADHTLNKGICLGQDQHDTAVPVIYDIGHAVANALKREFENNAAYLRFVVMISLRPYLSQILGL